MLVNELVHTVIIPEITKGSSIIVAKLCSRRFKLIKSSKLII